MNLLKGWGLLFIGSLFVFFSWPSKDLSIFLDGQEIKIPRQEADALEFFFKQLILKDGFAYTLIGEKPMSLSAYRDTKHPSFSYSLNKKMALGWKTWKKYQNHFLNSKFEMWIEEGSWSEKIKFILLIDKENVSKAIQANFHDFQNILQKTDFDFQNTHTCPFVKYQLKNHEALLGMLLGYGKGNAWWYFHRSKNLKNPPVWKPGMTTILRLIFNQIRVKDMFLPSFVGMANSDETLLLKRKYTQARKQLLHYYKKKDFLQATLLLFKNGTLPSQKPID